jgi:hypothetical protein
VGRGGSHHSSSTRAESADGRANGRSEALADDRTVAIGRSDDLARPEARSNELARSEARFDNLARSDVRSDDLARSDARSYNNYEPANTS